MRRTSILLDPGLLAELERIARRQGRPTAHAIRDALEDYVAAHTEQRALPGFVGLGHGPGEPPLTDPVTEEGAPPEVADAAPEA